MPQMVCFLKSQHFSMHPQEVRAITGSRKKSKNPPSRHGCEAVPRAGRMGMITHNYLGKRKLPAMKLNPRPYGRGSDVDREAAHLRRERKRCSGNTAYLLKTLPG